MLFGRAGCFRFLLEIRFGNNDRGHDGIRLHDSKKVAEEAEEDEMANKTASIVLKGSMQEKAEKAASKVIELLRNALPSQKDVLFNLSRLGDIKT